MSLNRGVPFLEGSDSSAFALQPKLKSSAGVPSISSFRRELKSFDSRVQEYGEWFSGFEWSIFGCVTYAKKQSNASASKAFTRYLRVLERSIKSRVAYVAVPENRTSGCGLPPIPLHWHFLMACPQHKEPQLHSNCSTLWKSNGNSKIERYDVQEQGAFYIAKTAKDANFEFRIENLDRMKYWGSDDLTAQIARNEYVPAPAKWRTEIKTLALRERVAP